MTPTRFRECLDVFHWSQRGFARIIGRGEGTVRQWARGAVSIPFDVAQWLESCASFMESHRPPERHQHADKQ
ncbi:helix-turn-helix domain-containing protein [Saccharibacter floricola]|uniref:Helix-turn-helix domain-containing protein n=1 Tax=Saccharibacter floricola DSM 15669 TaxID=1123227 RepID=A0ABQ0P0V5_9PROT|nr:hypothetical protein [Saccharibacter floricola]GBQ08428.1 hypothetical protein AA15669_1777 [Saccharibacter floricola DSM 15669]